MSKTSKKTLNRHHRFSRPLAMGLAVGSALVTMGAQAMPAATTGTTLSPALSPVVVTATRHAQPLSEVAGVISVVTRRDMDQMGATNFGQSLVNVPNVEVSDPFNPLSSKISVRGFSPEHNVYVLDGVVQSDSTQAGNVTYGMVIDPMLVKRIEVKKGSASTLYGAGAIGGVIHVSTLDAADMLHPDEHVGGMLRAGYNTLNRQKEGAGYVYGRTEQVDFVVGGQYGAGKAAKRANDYRYSGVDSGHKGLMAKAQWYVTPELTLKGSVNLEKQHYHNALNPKSQRFSTWDQKQSRVNLGAEYHANDWVNLDATLGAMKSDLEYANEVPVEFSNHYKQITFSLNNLAHVDAWGEHAIMVGVDSAFYAQKGEGLNPGQPVKANSTERPDAKAYDLGLFLQDQIQVGSYLEVTPGVRVSNYRRNSNKGLGTLSGTHVSPSLTLAVTPVKGLKFWGAYSHGYRPATMDELYFGMTSPYMDWVVVPNPDLKPETSQTYELGVDYLKAGLLGDDEAHVRLTVFDTRVKDEIAIEQSMKPGPTGKFMVTYRPVNKHRAKRQGLELNVDYRYENATLALSYGLLKAKHVKTGERLAGITPSSLGLRLGYTWPGLGLETWYRMNWYKMGRYPVDDDDPVPTLARSQAVHAIGASWTKALGTQRLSVNAAVNNLFNAKYLRTNESWGTGRALHVWMTWQF